MTKKTGLYSNIVYSTDPDVMKKDTPEQQEETISPSEQKIRVRTDKKHRGGKTVTLIENFAGSVSDKEDIGKKLKTFCGTGGSVKEGEILIQGDNRDKILQWLLKNGFKQSKISS